MSIFANLPTDISRDIYRKAVELRDKDVSNSVRLGITELIENIFKNECKTDIDIPGNLEIFEFYSDFIVDDIKSTVLGFVVGSAEYTIQHTTYFRNNDSDSETCMSISLLDNDKYTDIVCDVLTHYFPNAVIYNF